MRQDLTTAPIMVSARGEPGRPSLDHGRRAVGVREPGMLFLVWLTVGGICFGHSVWVWAKYAWGSELCSYTLLIPLISVYFAWSKGRPISFIGERPHWVGIVPLVAAFGTLGAHLWLVGLGWQPSFNDHVVVEMFAFFCFVMGGGIIFLSAETLRRAAFALGFLVFMVPPPDGLRLWLESALQHGSANVAQFLFFLGGTPLLRQDIVFQLPGITLEVAPQCSGIHSTLVLFMTSLVAGYVLLESSWRRVLLSVAVVPLALLRNGFRIFTVGQLCVSVSPDMINSYIHRKGGPVFFALSLIPFFLLLLLLRRGVGRQRLNYKC